MPEVPELLTLRNNLLRRFHSKVVGSFQIHKKIYLSNPKSEIISAFEGQRLVDVARVGKTIEMHFSNGQRLGIHLMRAGTPYLTPTSTFSHWSVFEMIFEDGTGFGMNDPMSNLRLTLNPAASPIPDVLTEELSFEYLQSVFRKSRESVLKPLLKDQKVIRGLGNAYVDEILWTAKIAPSSLSYLVPDEKIRDLRKAIYTVLVNAESNLMKLVGDETLMVERRPFMNVHHSKRPTDPEGNVIIKGEVGDSVTYWTQTQVLYDVDNLLSSLVSR